MYREGSDLAATAQRMDTPERMSEAFFDLVAPLGASYIQTRLYRKPTLPLTSERHWAAGGVVLRKSPSRWPGSAAFNYVCFECNPLLNAIRQGLTRYRFSDFAPHGNRAFGTYWEALSEAGIGEALCATAYGPGRAIASLHLGFRRTDFAPDEAQAVHMAGMVLCERLLAFADPDAPTSPALTLREMDVMCFVAEGKSDWEISRILGIAETTTRFHADNARRKMNAVNRTHAIAKMLSAGLL